MQPLSSSSAPLAHTWQSLPPLSAASQAKMGQMSSTASQYGPPMGQMQPLAQPITSDYIVRDKGNCSPPYILCTMSQIAYTGELLSTSSMQLTLELVDRGEGGPFHCSRCKGHINPLMGFIDQGRRFVCNLCGFIDETPCQYHCYLGPDGRCRDADERPESCKRIVEFVATKEFMARDPMPTVCLFLVDVSMNAIQTGATAAACSIINQAIADLPDGPRTMVGFATFDSTIHFHNLKSVLQQPSVLTVPDIQDIYTCSEADVIVQLAECRRHLEQLLENIPTMFQSNKVAESALGASTKAAFVAMKNTGGKLLVFQPVVEMKAIVLDKRKMKAIVLDKRKIPSRLPEDPMLFESGKVALDFLNLHKKKSGVVNKMNLLLTKRHTSNRILMHIVESNLQFQIVDEGFRKLKLLASEPVTGVLLFVKHPDNCDQEFYLYHLWSDEMVLLPRIEPRYEFLVEWKGCLNWVPGEAPCAVVCAVAYDFQKKYVRYHIFEMVEGDETWTCHTLKYNENRNKVVGPLVYDRSIYWIDSQGKLEFLDRNRVAGQAAITGLKVPTPSTTSILSWEDRVYIFQEDNIRDDGRLMSFGRDFDFVVSTAPPCVKMLFSELAGGHSRDGGRGQVILASRVHRHHINFYERQGGRWRRYSVCPCVELNALDNCLCNFAWVSA